MNIIQKLTPFFVILALLGLGAGGYFYYQNQKVQQEIQTIKTDLSAVQKAVREEIQKPAIDRISVNTGSASADSSQKIEVKAVLLNGTKTVSLTGKVEPVIKKAIPGVNIIEKDNAQSSGYEKTLIVVIDVAAKELADNLAKTLKATLSSLPAGENKPDDADLLIILGKDKTF